MLKRNKRKINVGPIMCIMIISSFLLVLSFILNKIGFSGYVIDPETHEKTFMTVNNIFSRTGLRYIFSNVLLNFKLMEPLAVLIMSFIALSILDSSGLLNHIFKPLKNVRQGWITFFIILVSIISTFIGDYCYAILLPFAGILYKYLDREPKNGILITYVGITIGYATGAYFNYNDILLNGYSTTAAKDVINNYSFEPLALLFIMLASSIIIAFVCSNIIDRKFTKKIKKSEDEQEKFVESKSALTVTFLAFLVMMLIAAYMIIPGLPLSGVLLDNNEKLYVAKLLGANAPFKDGFLLLFVIVFMICGYIYGRLSRNIKNAREYNKSISKSFENTGFLFAILFFSSIMISILEWTKIGEVLCLNFVSIMEKLEFTGLILIIIVMIICILSTILLPSTIVKWQLISPVMIPLLMRANISPAFTQMIFKVSDSIGKCFSPVYVYFIVMIGLLYKYDDNGEEVKLFGTMRKIFPIIIILSITWIVIIAGWYLLGLKTGINTYPTI